MGTRQSAGKEPMMVVEQENAFSIDLLPQRDEWLERFRADALCDFSILHTSLEAERRRVHKLLECSSDPVEERCIGAMLGLAVGDALGAPMEFAPVRYGSTQLVDMGQEEIWKIDRDDRGVAKNEFGFNKFELKPGQYTDDTSMAVCLADSLLVCRGFDGFDLRLRFLNWWQFGYNNAFKLDEDWRSCERCGSVGLGGNIGASLQEFQERAAEFTSSGDHHTSGNGSIMRLAPCAIFFRDDAASAMAAADRQSKTTHQGIEAAECSRLLAHILVKAFQGPLGDAASVAVRASHTSGSPPRSGARSSVRTSSPLGSGACSSVRTSSRTRGSVAAKSSALARGGRAIAGTAKARAGACGRGGSRGTSPAPSSATLPVFDQVGGVEDYKSWLLSDWCSCFATPIYSVQCLAASRAEDRLTATSAGPLGCGEYIVMVDKLHVRENEDPASQVLAELQLHTFVLVTRTNETGQGLLSEPLDGWVTYLGQSGEVQLVKPDWHEQRCWNWRAPEFHFAPDRVKKDPDYIGSYVMDCLSMALHCVWTTHDFRSAVLKSANMCGDADTVSAVTGQIAGAIYGVSDIPVVWREQLSRWDGGDLALKAWLMYHRQDEKLLARCVSQASRVMHR